MDYLCGPVALSLHHENHCWEAAKGKYCAVDKEDGQKICMDWGVEGKKWMTFNGHKRTFDYEGIFTWVPEKRGEMRQDVCQAKCKDLFLMKIVDAEVGWKWGTFVKTWFPPKPIPWEKGN